MTNGWLLVGLALCSCAIDDRHVKVGGACAESSVGGLVSDFSGARGRSCPAGVCSPELTGRPAVSLGEAEGGGLIFPYGSSGLDPIVLVLDPPPGGAAPGQALRAVVDSGSPRSSAPDGFDGFALRLLECVDASAYSGVSFTTVSRTTDGELGSCPLRFALQFMEGDAGTFAPLCPVRDCFPTESVLVVPGTTTLSFSESGGAGHSTALAGMQWEFSVPSEPPGGCTADFTLDDIRLVSTH